MTGHGIPGNMHDNYVKFVRSPGIPHHHFHKSTYLVMSIHNVNELPSEVVNHPRRKYISDNARIIPCSWLWGYETRDL